MPITIVGSWPEDDTEEFPLRGSRDEFAEACESIGRELAHAEQQIIVGNDSPISADYHIVKGIVNTARVDERFRPLIHVIRPEQGGSLFEEFWRPPYERLFTGHRRTQRSPEGAKIISVQDADAVLTIGGAGATYRAGLASIVARKRLVPIASFHGASIRLLDALEQYGRVKNINEFGPLGGPWTPFVMETALRLCRVTRSKFLIIHGHSREDRLDLQLWLRDRLNLSGSDVVLMADVPADGRTLPELFEDLAAEVDAAIAIATPDDVGGPQTKAPADYKPRARQNVWLEVGWFWGRLGRDKIMMLRKGDVEIPSDLTGLEYHPYTENPSEAGDHIRDFVGRIQRGA